MTQLALDVIFRSLGQNIVDSDLNPLLENSISASDASDATIYSAQAFLETVFADLGSGLVRPSSRAPTPMIVRSPSPIVSFHSLGSSGWDGCGLSTLCRLDLPGSFPQSPDDPARSKSVRIVHNEDETAPPPSTTPTKANGLLRSLHSLRLAHVAAPHLTPKNFMSSTLSAKQRAADTKTLPLKGDRSSVAPAQTPRRLLNCPPMLPQHPDVSSINVSSDPSAEYTVLISMYEVYNNQIFDLLTPPVKSAVTKEYRRRPLLFKNTELSPDRKVVPGLRKIICRNLQDALLVLEAGLHERRVAGTGSNSVSSRSHGFFCVEVKKRAKGRRNAHLPWGGSTLTVVDLAGS